VLPKALNAAGLAVKVDAAATGVDDLEPPHPTRATQSATPHIAIDSLPSKPKEFPYVRVRAISSTSAFVKSRARVYPVERAGERLHCEDATEPKFRMCGRCSHPHAAVHPKSSTIKVSRSMQSAVGCF
jgi:hypothetical protein